MSVLLLAGGLPPEFGDALIAIDVVALAIFFGMLYPTEIAAAARRVVSLLSPFTLLARLRLWRSANKIPH